MNNKISAIRSQTYDVEQLTDDFKRHFDNLGGLGKMVKKNAKILIKPNLIINRAPDTATTTHPAIIEAVVKNLLPITKDITIADSPGRPYDLKSLKQVYYECRLIDALSKYNVTFNFDTSAVPVTRERNRTHQNFKMIKPAVDADFIINIAKMKTHALANYSGCVKNLYGCIAGREKTNLHFVYPDRKIFCSMLVDLCETVSPQLSILDGIMAMEGNGPTGGSPIHAGVTLVSQNPYNIDLLATYLMKFKIEQVYTVMEAIARGHCVDNVQKLEYVSDKLSDLTVIDFKKPNTVVLALLDNTPTVLRSFVAKLISPKPVINRKKCIGCAECAVACPMRVIKIVDKKAVIDHERCVKCYCCHEMCPEKAINIKGFMIGKK